MKPQALLTERVAVESNHGNKRQLRLERKKRKILALAEVMLLNEQDRSTNPGVIQFGDTPSTSSSTDTRNEVDADGVLTLLDTSNTATDNDPESKRRKLTDSEYLKLKADVNQKRAKMRHVPKLRLKEVGEAALMQTPAEERIPLLLDDIQGLLMYALLRTDSPMNCNRWAALEKTAKLTHTTVVFIEGLTSNDFTEYGEQHLKECRKIFHNILQVVSPSERLVEELACVPLSDAHKDILVAEYGSLEAAMLVCKNNLLIRRSIFDNIEDDVAAGSDQSTACATGNSEEDGQLELPPGDKFPRTQLLLSPIQMINEDYPLPLTGSLSHRYEGFIRSSDIYAPVTPRSPMFALDCEMCKTTVGSELTRVSIVDEKGNEFYEALVKPPNPIVDYLTKFSGITRELMANVTTTLDDVHVAIKNKLPRDAILVGQSLNFDLNALKIMHPYVIDTSILYNMTGSQGTKSKLKVLTKKFLKRDIQCGSKGHNSIEDCTASLELVKLKLAHNIYYGDQWLQDRRNYHKRANKVGIANPEDVEQQDAQKGIVSVPDATSSEITATLFGHAHKRNKRSAILTNADNLDTFGSYFGEAIKASAEAQKQLLHFEKLASEEEVVRCTTANSLNYDFNLCSLQLKAEHITTPEGKKAKMEQIDTWIKDIYSAMSVNGLLVVLLAGGEVNRSSRMAVAMIQTKKF